MKLTACLFLLITATSAFAQSPAIDIQVTGEHRIAPNETPDTARELALADAENKILLKVVAQLQDRADVKALRFTPNQLDAYVAALLNIHEPAAPPAFVESRTSCRVNVRVRLDANGTAHRLERLRKDQEASQSAGTDLEGDAGSAADASRASRQTRRHADRGGARPDGGSANRRPRADERRTRARQAACGGRARPVARFR